MYPFDKEWIIKSFDPFYFSKFKLPLLKLVLDILNIRNKMCLIYLNFLSKDSLNDKNDCI